MQDMIACRKCGKAIIEGLGQGMIVTCPHCKAVHQVAVQLLKSK